MARTFVVTIGDEDAVGHRDLPEQLYDTLTNYFADVDVTEVQPPVVSE